MKSFFRLSKLGPVTKVLVGFAVVLVVAAAVFDWNWFRRPLERYLIEKSGREVKIGDLHVKLGFALEPTVRVRNVYIENARWAARQPMAVAGEASFTFSLRSVWEKRPVISLLVLRDADIDMERQANGLRNWRLTKPDDRGPGVVKVLTLEAHRSKIRFFNGAIDFDVVAAASPLESVSTVPQTGEALSNKIDFKGVYRGADFSGSALAGAVLSFRESGKSFPLRGHAVSGKTRFDIEGIVADFVDLSAVDAHIRIAGPTLAKLHPFVSFRPAASRPFALEADVREAQKEYTFTRLRGKIGTTEITGNASYNHSADRPLLKAALRSEAADVADLSALVGVNYRAHTGTIRSAQVDAAPNPGSELQPPDRADSGSGASERMFPQHAIPVERLRATDARVTIDARKLHASDMPALESLSLSADLTDGVIEVKRADLGMADGHAVGSFIFDGRHEPPSARATIDAHSIRIEKLFPSVLATAHGVGALAAHIKVAGQGNSFAAIMGSATGSFAAVVDGGRISNMADAKLGLNAGKVIGLFFRGDRDIALNCGAIAFDIRNGTGKSQTIVLDTEQTHTEGVGTVNLKDEQFELLLTPQPKHPGIFTLHSSIRIDGSFKRIHFSVAKRVAMDRGGSAAGPLAQRSLLLPLTGTGRFKESPCARILGNPAPAASSVVAKE
jgi:uncharacterized protein involved in outer membrane biogenesis